MGDELNFITKSRMHVQAGIESDVTVLDACWPCEYQIPFHKIIPSLSASRAMRRCVILSVVIENTDAKEAQRQKKS